MKKIRWYSIFVLIKTYSNASWTEFDNFLNANDLNCISNADRKGKMPLLFDIEMINTMRP